MRNLVSRVAIICAFEEAIRDEVKRMCDTDSLAELDTMALHAKENIENLRSVKYKTLVKESPSLVEDLVKAFGEDGTWLERQGIYTLTLAEAKQRAVDIIESVLAKTEPQTERSRQ